MAARPDAMVHQLTDLSSMDLAATARLRLEGTRNLVEAAKAAGIYPMGPTIAFREFVQFDGDFGIALRLEDSQADLPLSTLLALVNYFGKRGGFFQLQVPPEPADALDSQWTLLTRPAGAFPINGMLQMLDDGRLTDGQGRTVDFTQTLVLMTSNLRHADQVRQFFRPEFVNRLDEILVFDALEPGQIRKIVDVQTARLAKHLAEQEIGLELTDAAKDELAKQGYSPEFGARPLKRAIQKNVQNLLADAILGGKVVRGDVAVVDVSKGNFWVSARKPETEAGAEKSGAKLGSAG